MTEGVVRAKQDILDKSQDGFTVLPVLIHGDAAFAGQGVVAETLNLSQLRGYRTGGTVHIVVNNQVGFTTSPMESRSSVYATDVARMIQAPIFHVNGDDPEAVARVGRLAFAYREAFRKDVVIDMVCYRRRGHNEGDNPSFTQPLMYDLIEARRSVRKLYTESLIARGDLTMEEAEAALRDYQQQLERAFTETREAAELPAQPGTVHAARGRRPPGRPRGRAHRDHAGRGEADHRDPGVASPTGSPCTRGSSRSSTGAPRASARTPSTGRPASCSPSARVLQDGHPVRLVGQDSRRGTFGQRHAVLVDRNTGAEYTPLKRLDNGQARFMRLRLAAVRVRRDGLRVRLLGRAPGRAGAVGSAVRRLRRTARRPSSTSSSAPASRSGARSPASSCCSRTATRARAPTTPPRGSSGSCRCARRTT